ncbi:MAG: hypothetical protein R3277_02855 [Brumimicrobium sp.]|nr:hypothetical protein [Brumimicrobium sp.]
MKKMKMLTAALIVGIIALGFTSCKKEGCTDPKANNYSEEAKKDDGSCTYPKINMNTTNSGKSGDVVGGGGTASQSTTFTQNNSTLGWDMAQDASTGSFNLTVKDANGSVVINKTLTAGSGAQDAAGTSAAGTPGTWTLTVTLTDFVGKGDYSIQ